ncbi:MAG: trypsin-like serine protease [Phycisphaerales bacterium]
MRSLKFAVALIVGSFATSTLAQQTLDWPVGELQDYHLDSGVQNNPALGTQTVFLDVVAIRDAAWLRIYFAEVELGADSFIRLTSLLDHEVQELDANGLAMWDNSSAYFNGNAVLVELVAGPGTTKNRLVIDQVAMEVTVALPAGTCGICGPDDRVPSDEDWSGRLLPAGCTASVWNTESCLVSAGHCISFGGMVIEFRVPNSTNNCNIVHPPVADQFTISSFLFTNGGVGNDWSVLTTNPNNLGQTVFDRYGEFRPIASSPPGVGNALTIWGFGIDSPCMLTQTQQTSSGTVTSVGNTLIRHNVDATFGNSGSGIIRDGEILAIVTHCPCPNWATRVDHPNFANAREQLCPGSTCPWDLDNTGTVGATDLLRLLVNWGPCADCNGCPADFDGNCTVGATDLLALLVNWGPCP